MKVLFINTDDYMGGAAIAGKRIAGALREHYDLDIQMLVQKKKFSDSYIHPAGDSLYFKATAFLRFALERLYFTFFEKSRNVRFAFSPANTGMDVSFHPLVKQADIIHLHFINFGFLSIETLQSLFETGKPIVWTMHDMWPFTGGCHHSGFEENYRTGCGHCDQYLKNPSAGDLSAKILKKKEVAYRSLKKAVFAGCSEWLSNRARSSYLLKDHYVTSVPNPIDTHLFSPGDKKAIRTELGLDPGKQYILFVAMKASVLWKGWSYLEKALEILKFDIRPDISPEFLILGEVDTDISDAIPFKTHLFGRINDVRKISNIYNAADVFVIPSIMENLPNTVMEALSSGVPCVGFETGGIPEMIRHQENGYLAEYKSSEDLARGIDWVLNKADRKALGENGRKKALENYAAKKVAGEYLRIYEELLKS